MEKQSNKIKILFVWKFSFVGKIKYAFNLIF